MIHRAIPFQNLRNPAFLFAAFVMIMIPGFIGLCQHQGLAVTSALWVVPDFCPTEFLHKILLRESLLSFLLVVISFESIYRLGTICRLNTLPKSVLELLMLQTKILIPILLSTTLYLTVKIVSLYVESNLFFDSEFLSALLLDIFKITLLTFLVINSKQLYAYYRYQRNNFISQITVVDNNIEVTLSIADVISFEKTARYYYAYTGTNQYRVDYSLKELENILPKNHFIRINRSTIVNVSFIRDYSYWEHDKYNLRLINDQEYSLTRLRMKLLKKLLKPVTNK